ncbi:hypothetical protein BKI52_39520 [marine bacterium AO1-C]|nr:hypothetical protein BKI52_39520 [marine bacterium AO1-C]
MNKKPFNTQDLGNFDKVYRHGDVIIFQFPEANLSAIALKKMNKVTLAYGEVTGHAHRLKGDIAVAEQIPEAGVEPVLFEVQAQAVLTHEEHDTIVLERGVYLKVNQVEYDPFSDLIRAIRD